MATHNPDPPETLGRKLVDAVRAAAGDGKADVEVEADGQVARARIDGAGPYGSAVDELTVVGAQRDGGGGEAIDRQAEQLERKLSYLPERIRRHEVEPGLGTGILRSHPDDMRDREYHEFRLHGGREAEVRRYRYDGERQERDRIPQKYAHETLERLTDDLADALSPADDD